MATCSLLPVAISAVAPAFALVLYAVYRYRQTPPPVDAPLRKAGHCPPFITRELPHQEGSWSPILADLFAEIEVFEARVTLILIPAPLWPRIKKETGATRGRPGTDGNVWGADVFLYDALTHMVVVFPHKVT